MRARLIRALGAARLVPKGMVEQQRTLQVFLCHSSGDKENVRELYWRLRADGVSPWFDEEDLLPGQDWNSEIKRAVTAADVIIICLSNESVKKTGYVQKEIKLALDVADEQPDGEIFLVPLKLEECNVPERLRRWQWVNLFDKRGYELLIKALHHRADSLGVNLRREEKVRFSEYSPTRLSDALNQVWGILGDSLVEKRIKVQITVDPFLTVNVPIHVVTFALLHLISNSRDALSKGGRILISAEEDKHMIRCRVSDNGPGVPKEHMYNLFKLGYSLKAGHSGIGLYAVNQSLLENGGLITLLSTDSSGTIFEIQFPKAR